MTVHRSILPNEGIRCVQVIVLMLAEYMCSGKTVCSENVRLLIPFVAVDQGSVTNIIHSGADVGDKLMKGGRIRQGELQAW
jgi:hypothetical protein